VVVTIQAQVLINGATVRYPSGAQKGDERFA
jgi:hypothetical protein